MPDTETIHMCSYYRLSFGCGEVVVLATIEKSASHTEVVTAILEYFKAYTFLDK